MLYLGLANNLTIVSPFFFLDINRLRSGGKGPYQGGQPESVAYAEAASGRIQSGPPDRRQRRAGSDATGQKAT